MYGRERSGIVNRQSWTHRYRRKRDDFPTSAFWANAFKSALMNQVVLAVRRRTGAGVRRKACSLPHSCKREVGLLVRRGVMWCHVRDGVDMAYALIHLCVCRPISAVGWGLCDSIPPRTPP